MFLSRLRTQTLRSLSSSSARAEAHSTILDILREKSPAETQAAARKKRILILSPDETKDKTLSKLVSNRRKPKNVKDLKVVRVEELNLATLSNDLKASIEFFKPEGSGTGNRSTMDCLKESFTKMQLAEYVSMYATTPYKKSANKGELAKYIVTHIWNQPNSVKQIFQKESIPLSHQEMFLLLSHRGAFLRVLKSTVSSLDFNTKRNELVLVGTERQLQNAKINLANRFDSVHKEVLDLTTIQNLYQKKFGAFTFEDIGKMIEVYFHHLDGNTFELCAMNPSQIKRVQRLLVWFLDYNLHQKEFLHLPANLESCSLISVTDDYGMSWKNRSKAHFRLVDDSVSVPASASLEQDLELFKDDNLKSLDLDLNLSDLRKPAEPSALAEETYDLLSSLGLEREDLVQEPVSEVAEEPENLKVSSDGIISEAQKEKLYQQLTDFNYRQKLAGLDKNLDQAMFTVTLGHVLFPKPKEKNSLFAYPPATTDLPKNVTFHSNVPLVYDQALVKATEGLEDSGSDDPHTYSLQFKFLPSPYSENVDQHMKYPPVEMWVQLNGNSVPDLETVQLVSVEGENNAHVCLPQHASDLKITCQMTGQLLEAVDPEGQSNVELSSLLNSTSSKYPKLSSQPGLQAFLEESKLELNRKSQTSIAPSVELYIGNKPVTYSFVSLNYRRELMVELEGQVVQLSIIDGGSLGGRRVEVRFVGDFTKDIDRESFDRLVDYCGGFVREL